MTLVKRLSMLGAMPSVNEAARRLLFHRSTYSEFDTTHGTPRNFAASDKKSAINRSAVVNL